VILPVNAASRSRFVHVAARDLGIFDLTSTGNAEYSTIG